MPKKILLIEDEDILIEMYQDKFRAAGYKVIVATSLEQGLDKITKENPSLVLLDILLPEENGIQFLKRWRAIAKDSKIPIIAFSNYDDAPTKKEAFSLGVKEYLIKTEFTPTELLEKIRKYLE